MKHLRSAALLAGMLALPLGAHAADLDVFSSGPNSAATMLPNVLFIIDNTANWNVAFSNEMRALSLTLANMPVNKFNVGIMLQTEMGGTNQGPAGGYVRAALRPMDERNKQLYVNFVNSLDKLYDKGSAGNSAVAMAEAYHYLKGMAPYAGRMKAKADYTGNTSGTSASNALYGLGGNALNSFAANLYTAPLSDCNRNYVIYISNGPNQQSSSANVMANNLLAAAAGGGAAGSAAIAQIALSPSGSQSNPLDEWARFMKKSSLAVTTYAIDVDPTSYGAGPGWTALLKSMSGMNNYTAVRSASGYVEIADAINNTLNKIQSVDSVFAPLGLPASPDVQGAYLNQVYVGMFRPDPDAKPRWMGNLKQYRIGQDSSLSDADGYSAVNNAYGFIGPCARSYWTPTEPNTYWANAPRGNCIPRADMDPAAYAISDSPDGNSVEKGGQAYRLRQANPASRLVMTCGAGFGACTSLFDFNNLNVPASALGASTTSERDSLISWARGANFQGELGKNVLEMRPSAHGDVVHSNPLALAYGQSWMQGKDVVVYYGSNDGMLHAVNGNRSVAIGGAAPGDELWAFMPPEFFPQIKRLRDNTVPVAMAAPQGYAASGSAKPYGIDGPLTAYRDGGRSWMFAAMRRGGRALYAFDVSYPMAPTLKWKLGCSADGMYCTSGASGLGQTWGTPTPVKSNAYGNAAPLLVMGGGYDDCEDSDVNGCTPSSKGNKIYVIDADSGAIVNTLHTERGVVGEVNVQTDAQGNALVGYAADLGGNVYRIDMGAAAPSAWSITRIAALGCATLQGCSNNRKFMFGPSVMAEADGSFNLYLGSGDREKPLGYAFYPSTNAVQNHFFKLTDRPGDITWLASERSNCGADIMCMASLLANGNVASTCGATVAPTGKGWAMALRPTEQVVTMAATRFGVSTFSTHMPDVLMAGTCSARLGRVHVYNLDTGTAAPAGGTTCNDVVEGVALPPGPRKLDVCMDDACSVKRPICIGCSTKSPLQTQESVVPAGSVEPSGARPGGWYMQ